MAADLSGADIRKRFETGAPMEAPPVQMPISGMSGSDIRSAFAASAPPDTSSVPFDYSQSSQLPSDPATMATDMALPPAARIATAMGQAWRDTNLLTPQAEAENQKTLVGKYLSNPLAWLEELPLKGMAAVGAGLGQGAYEAGNVIGGPALGRDLNVLSQVTPIVMSGVPPTRLPGAPPNALEIPRGPAQTDEVYPPRMAPQGPAPAFAPPNALQPPAAPLEPPPFVPPNPQPATPEGIPLPVAANDTGAAAPRAVGAAASREGSPASVIGITPQEEAAYRTSAEGQKLLEPQPIGIPDANVHVQGNNPNLAEIEQTVNTARELKSLGIRSEDVSQEAKQIAQDANENRSIHLNNAIGSAPDILREKAAQQTDIESQKAAVFGRGGADADIAPIVQHMQEVLNQPTNRQNTPLQTVYAPLVKRLVNDDGSPKIVDPEELWGLRMDINRMASKRFSADDPNLHYVAHDLNNLSGVIDKQIGDVRPGYDDMMQTYAAHARKIDEMEVLQGHKNDLYAGSGGQMRMTFDKVQRMMKNIVDNRATGPTDLNQYKSITPETMGKLWALRDDLRRSASAIELAKAPGSDTMQNAWDAIKGLASGPEAQQALHAFAAAHFGLPGYVASKVVAGALSPILSGRRAATDTARGMQMLHPPNLLRDPNAPP